MTSGIQLVPLRCPSCSSGLSGDSQAVFLYCGECGSGYEVTSSFELNPVPIYFARMKSDANRFRPFWAFDAKLNLNKREAKGGFFSSPNGLLKRFEESGTLRFYVAAYAEDVDRNKPVSLDLTNRQPQLEFIHKQPRIDGFLFSQKDARKIADHLFMTSEIEQKDTIRSLSYKLELTNPMVIVIGLQES